MEGTNVTHSAPKPGRSEALYRGAVQLYAVLSSGHPALGYNVDPRGAALTAVGKDGKRYAVEETGVGVGENAPPWQPAREVVRGRVVERRFNARVLAQHLAGSYSVAPAAAGWVQWVCLDIDAHSKGDAPELVARRLARAQADRVLALVWRAFGCSAERHPIVLRSPGGGYHVWFPLTRGPDSANAEHTWPAMTVRGWFERHLSAAGAELAPGVLEVFPSGHRLRAPCGRGMVLLRATRPNDPDALGLEPWPGTMATRVDWSAVREELVVAVRQVRPMLEVFLAQWEAQRRTPAEWMGRPEAGWDPTWGPLAYRDDETSAEGGRNQESPAAGEKNSGLGTGGQDCRPQQSDDSPHGALGALSARRSGGAGRKGVEGLGRRQVQQGRRQGTGKDAAVRTTDQNLGDPAPEVDTPPDPAVDRLVRGPEFRKKKNELLTHGVTQPSTRHDAVLTLAFYWAGTCGHEIEHTLTLLDRWCVGFAHAGSRLSSKPETFRTTCLYEARNYLESHAHRWQFRGRGDGGGLGTLTTADHVVLEAVDPRVRREAGVILAWLAGRADADGRIGDPVYLAARLLERLCGDARVEEGGQQRRATVLAIAELERLGVLTLASNYCVGSRPRAWCCWYQFGSGVLPRAVELPASTWEALESSGYGVRPPVALAVAPESPQDAPSRASVMVRVVGEKTLPDALLSVLSDGARGPARMLVTAAAGVEAPTVEPAARSAWFLRPYQARHFTPAELMSASAATVTPFPDIEALRRMSRRERLAAVAACQQATRPGAWAWDPGHVIPLRKPAPASGSPPTAESVLEPASGPQQPRPDLSVGVVAGAAPQDSGGIVTVRSLRKGDP